MSTRETLSTSGTLLAGLWMLAGLFSDGWAHLNVQSTQESFFTPSHLVIYSGFAVAALVVTRPLWGGRPSMASVQRVPGMLAGLIGVLLFGLGGAADLVWHETLGIEVSVEALLSPTHLLLLVGTVLVLTVPLVAGWQSTPREPLGGGRSAPPWPPRGSAWLCWCSSPPTHGVRLIPSRCRRSHRPRSTSRPLATWRPNGCSPPGCSRDC